MMNEVRSSNEFWKEKMNSVPGLGIPARGMMCSTTRWMSTWLVCWLGLKLEAKAAACQAELSRAPRLGNGFDFGLRVQKPQAVAWAAARLPYKIITPGMENCSQYAFSLGRLTHNDVR
jgi:hypothetical protein